MPTQEELDQVRTVDLWESCGVVYEEVDVTEGAALPWHDHPTTYIDLWLSGHMQASWHSDVQPHVVSVLPAGIMHRSLALTRGRTLQFIVSQDEAERMSEEIGPLAGPLAFESTFPTFLAYRMYRGFKSRDDLTDLDLTTHLAELWWTVSGRDVGLSDSGAPWLRRTEGYLREHFASSVRVEEVAVEIGVHRTHLMREFRRAYRQTMGDYLRGLRVEQACKLLRKSELSFAEIAAEVGFSDQSHLNRTLKSHLGVSPGEFVRQSR